MSGAPRRILFVSHFPPRIGGMALQSKILADRLTDEGFEVIRLNVHIELSADGFLAKTIKAIVQPLALLWGLARSLSKVRHVHVAVCSFWGFMPLVLVMPICRLVTRSVSVTYHGGNAAEFLQKHHSLAAPLLQGAHFVIVPSHFLEKIFRQHGIACRVVPVIGDFEHFRARTRRRIAPVLVCNRHLEPLYDVATVLKAFRKVKTAYPSARLIIAGTGSEREKLAEYSLRHDLQVEFRGAIPFTEMNAVMTESDIFINPSTVDNMPMSVLEALYCGLLVITTPVGELPTIIRHGEEGLFYIPGDDDSLATTITFALLNQERSVRCCINARSVARMYTWSRLRGNYLALFRNDTDKP